MCGMQVNGNRCANRTLKVMELRSVALDGKRTAGSAPCGAFLGLFAFGYVKQLRYGDEGIAGCLEFRD